MCKPQRKAWNLQTCSYFKGGPTTQVPDTSDINSAVTSLSQDVWSLTNPLLFISPSVGTIANPQQLHDIATSWASTALGSNEPSITWGRTSAQLHALYPVKSI